MSEENTPTEENPQAQSGQNEEQAAPLFAIRRIYLKDLSFETPMGVEGLASVTKPPKIEQELNVQVNPLPNSQYEIVLLLTITAKHDDKVVFLVEVKQAGLFEIANMPKQALGQLINANCPNILFPYARETIDSVLNRGGFTPLNLPPINFDAVFAQALSTAQKQQQQQQAEQQADA